MEQNRLNIAKDLKPLLRVDRRFSVAFEQRLGNKVSLSANFTILERLKDDSDGNERYRYVLRLNHLAVPEKDESKEIMEKTIMRASFLNEIEPTVLLPESFVQGLDDMRPGDNINTVLSCMLIDQTKSFAILAVNHVHLLNTSRI